MPIVLFLLNLIIPAMAVEKKKKKQQTKNKKKTTNKQTSSSAIRDITVYHLFSIFFFLMAYQVYLSNVKNLHPAVYFQIHNTNIPL